MAAATAVGVSAVSLLRPRRTGATPASRGNNVGGGGVCSSAALGIRQRDSTALRVVSKRAACVSRAAARNRGGGCVVRSSMEAVDAVQAISDLAVGVGLPCTVSARQKRKQHPLSLE
jgi:hypothetical protein